MLSFCFRRQGALVEKGDPEHLFCTPVLPKGAESSTQTVTRNFSAEHCGCVVTFRILQDTLFSSVNAYLFLVTLKISPSTWLLLSCMPSSLVYEPLVLFDCLKAF